MDSKAMLGNPLIGGAKKQNAPAIDKEYIIIRTTRINRFLCRVGGRSDK